MTRFFALFACILPCFALSAVADEKSEPAKQEKATNEWIALSDDLSAFQQPTATWKVVGNAHLNTKNKKTLIAEPGQHAIINGEKILQSPDLLTKRQWGDVEVSFEFMIPQGSNSGVKLNGAYEIQIRDTCKQVKLDGDVCGGIYPRADLKPPYHYLDEGVAPRVNAAKAAGEWQTLHILFRAPKFDANGHKIANARFVRVTLNGQLIHENVEVRHPTGWRWTEKEHATGPLMLQGDHGQVIYRNVRIRPLEKSASEN